MASPAASIIVVNWNGRRFLADCLGALRRQTCQDFEVILVDNGSTDDSVAFVQAEFPEVRVLRLESNTGFAGGNWVGYEQARSQELIVLLNNDTEVAPGWLQSLIDASAQFPRVGSFASKMLYFTDRNRIDNCGFGVTPAGVTVEIGRDCMDGPAFDVPGWVFGACGGAVAYRRAMLDDVGFLDRDTFMIYEDLDLAFRAQLRGWACRFVPDARVYHYCHGSSPPGSSLQIWCAQRNIELVFVKNMPAGVAVCHLPQRLLYEFGALIYFTRIGGFKAFCRAKWAALASLPRWMRLRQAIQRGRRVAPEQLPFTTDAGWLWARLRKAFAPGGSVTPKTQATFTRPS